MKMIFTLKMAVDLAMIIVLHCLSGYHLFGNRAHDTGFCCAGGEPIRLCGRQ